MKRLRCKACKRYFQRAPRSWSQTYCVSNCKQKTNLEREMKKKLHNIKFRCENPKDRKYKNYGGRGIKCLLNVKDMVRLWKRDHASLLTLPSLDRIDTKGDYYYMNCRFIEAADNTSRRWKPDHELQSIRSWARRRNLKNNFSDDNQTEQNGVDNTR